MLLLVGFVVLATLAASLIIVERNILAESHARLQSELAQSLAGFRRAEARSFEHLATLATALESNPSFQRACKTDDYPAMLAYLREVQEGYGCDLILVLGRQGALRVRTDEKSDPGYSMAEMPGVRTTLEGYQYTGYWQESGRLIALAIVPIMGPQDAVEGCLVVGNRVDEQLADKLSRDTGSPLRILSNDREAASSQDAPPLGPEVLKCLPRLRQPGDWAEFQNGKILGLVAPLGQDGFVVLYRDLHPTLEFLLRTRLALTAIGLIALIVALMASAPVIGRVTDPVELFQTVFGNVPDGLCHIDRNLVVQSLNPAGCKLLGCTAEKARGTPLGELAEFRPPIKLAGGRVEDGIISTPSGQFAAAYVVAPMHEGGGVVVVFRDISPVKAMQRELVDASRLAGMADVASSVLHNVGNAMTSVNVSGHLLNEKLEDSKLESLVRAVDELQKDPDELARFLTESPRGKKLPVFLAKFARHLQELMGSLGEETRRLQTHVTHIQHLIRVQQSHARQNPEVSELCSLAEVVEQAMTVCEAAGPPKGLEVVRNFVELPPVRCDRHKLIEILVNLIRNAFEAMNEAHCSQPRLTLTLRLEPPAMACIEVADNGIGIEAENLTRIFQSRFTTKPAGHGFGLHSCACAATELKGKLLVESDGPGLGAKFLLKLPLEAPTES